MNIHTSTLDFAARFRELIVGSHANVTQKSYELLTMNVGRAYLAQYADAIQGDDTAYRLFGSSFTQAVAGAVRAVGEVASDVWSEVTGSNEQTEEPELSEFGDLVRTVDTRLRMIRDDALLSQALTGDEDAALNLLNAYLRCIRLQREALFAVGQRDFTDIDKLQSDIEAQVQRLTAKRANSVFGALFATYAIGNPFTKEELAELNDVYGKLQQGEPLSPADIDCLMRGLLAMYQQHERLHRAKEALKSQLIDFFRAHPYVSKVSANATALALGGLLLGPMGAAAASMAINKFIEEQLHGAVSDNRVEQLAGGVVEVLAGMAGGGSAGAVAAAGSAIVNEAGSNTMKEGAAFGGRAYLFQLAGLPPSMAASSSVLVALASKKTAIVREMLADINFAWRSATENPAQAALIFAQTSTRLLRQALEGLISALGAQNWAEAALRSVALAGPGAALAFGHTGLAFAALSAWLSAYLTEKFFRSSAAFTGPASLDNPSFTQAVSEVYAQSEQGLSALEEVMLHLVSQAEEGELSQSLVSKLFEQDERLADLLPKT